MRNAFDEDMKAKEAEGAAFRAWDQRFGDIRKSATNGHFEEAVRKVVEEQGAELEVSGNIYTVLLSTGVRLPFTLIGDKLEPLEERQEIKVNADLIPTIGHNTKAKRAIHRVLGHIIAKGFLTLSAGQGGVGKSAWSAGACIDITKGGGNCLGIPVNKIFQSDFNVLYVNLEDGQDFVDRTFQAVIQRHGSPKNNRLFAMGKDTLSKVISGGKLRLLAVDPSTHEAVLNEPVWAALRQLIKELMIDVLWLDPMKDIYGGVSMGNEAMNVLYSAFSDLAVEMDIAVVAVAHTRKPSGTSRGDQDQHDVKHGTEAVDTSRCVLNKNAVGQTQKADWGVEAHRNIVKCSVTKSNIGPKRNSHYELVIERVTCADGNEEDVVVPIPFQPPATGRAMEAIWPDIRQAVTNNFVKAASNAATDENGIAIRDVMERALANAGKPPAMRNSVLKEMIDAGWLVKVKDQPEGHRHDITRFVLGDNEPGPIAGSDA